MGESEERILADELGRFGDGGLLAAPHVSNDRFEIAVDVRSDPDSAAAAFSGAIARMGRLLDGHQAGPEFVVAGVVGGGFMNLNPAVVVVRIAMLADGRCVATLTGNAKEGLIKQRAGEKAVRRVLGARELADICGPAT